MVGDLTWCNATTQWVVKSLVNFVFGLKPRLDGLTIDPCLPPDWKTCGITKIFRGCTYDITYHQDAGTDTPRITADGAPVEGGVLPYRDGARICVEVYC